MLKQIFCKHQYYFDSDVQITPRTSFDDSKEYLETTHNVYVRCSKCMKERYFTPYITMEINKNYINKK